jgi:hypothetical protein
MVWMTKRQRGTAIRKLLDSMNAEQNMLSLVCLNGIVSLHDETLTF